MSDGRSAQRIISWTSYVLYWEKRYLWCYLGKTWNYLSWIRFRVFFLVGPELSQSKHAGSWESGKLDLGCPGSHFRCARAFQECTTELHRAACSISASYDYLAFAKLLFKEWLFLESASVRACRNLVFFPSSASLAGSSGDALCFILLYCFSQPWFCAINTWSFAPLLSRGLVSMSQKVTSYTTFACNLIFNTVSNTWKSLMTLRSMLTLAQGGLNPNTVPTFDARRWYHLPRHLSLTCLEVMLGVLRQPQRRACTTFKLNASNNS